LRDEGLSETEATCSRTNGTTTYMKTRCFALSIYIQETF
jgi:hypothetical protein